MDSNTIKSSYPLLIIFQFTKSFFSNLVNRSKTRPKLPRLLYCGATVSTLIFPFPFRGHLFSTSYSFVSALLRKQCDKLLYIKHKFLPGFKLVFLPRNICIFIKAKNGSYWRFHSSANWEIRGSRGFLALLK